MDTMPIMVEKENLTVRIDKPLRDQLDEIATKEDRSVASVVRILLVEALRARAAK